MVILNGTMCCSHQTLPINCQDLRLRLLLRPFTHSEGKVVLRLQGTVAWQTRIHDIPFCVEKKAIASSTVLNHDCIGTVSLATAQELQSGYAEQQSSSTATAAAQH